MNYIINEAMRFNFELSGQKARVVTAKSTSAFRRKGQARPSRAQLTLEPRRREDSHTAAWQRTRAQFVGSF